MEVGPGEAKYGPFHSHERVLALTIVSELLDVRVVGVAVNLDRDPKPRKRHIDHGDQLAVEP
jgi:hypothetical protein